ncbi:MAG TPA: HEAT repeat domain-containing protein [Clostridia bacterium]|nr:HEAT repeat domain-containing protein [Clostridia bacterium]
MKKVQEYAEKLKVMENPDDYLMQESGLPGPRGNLELMQAVAETGSEELFLHLLSFTPDKAPVNSPEEFLAACGTVGLGRLVSEGRAEYLKLLRNLASDPRWRTREAVAMALQLYGETHMDELLKEMKLWAQGSSYEKRAAAAALCEPRLLGRKDQVLRVLEILDGITESIADVTDRKDEGFTALRKGMAYCWSVAIVYNKDEGKRLFEGWIGSQDKDIKWILRENLKKDRLKRIDEAWVLECGAKVK